MHRLPNWYWLYHYASKAGPCQIKDDFAFLSELLPRTGRITKQTAKDERLNGKQGRTQFGSDPWTTWPQPTGHGTCMEDRNENEVQQTRGGRPYRKTKQLAKPAADRLTSGEANNNPKNGRNWALKGGAPTRSRHIWAGHHGPRDRTSGWKLNELSYCWIVRKAKGTRIPDITPTEHGWGWANNMLRSSLAPEIDHQGDDRVILTEEIRTKPLGNVCISSAPYSTTQRDIEWRLQVAIFHHISRQMSKSEPIHSYLLLFHKVLSVQRFVSCITC